MPASHTVNHDTIIIRNLAAKATVGPDRWDKIRPQPVRISIFLETTLAAAGTSDNVADTVDYGLLFKRIINLVDDNAFDDLHALAEAVAMFVLAQNGADAVRVTAEALNQFLSAGSLGWSVSRTRSGNAGAAADVIQPDQAFINDLRADAIIGVNPREREWKQPVNVNLVFHDPTRSKLVWNEISSRLTKVIEDSSYLTLEAFATRVAREACNSDGIESVTVRAEKPKALVSAEASGVQITRNKGFFTTS